MYKWQRKKALKKAYKIFDNQYKAIIWMSTPSRVFNNKTPNASKYKDVIAELHRIDQGIFI